VEVLLKRLVVRDGERVTVAEVNARGVPGAQRESCLICETDYAMRRIWRYPADWHHLEDAKVAALFDAPHSIGEPRGGVRH
jgi:hypothetical protein